jgi:glycerate 2-kinase
MRWAMLVAVRHLVAAPDKFRGTATASDVARAAVQGAERAGWSGEAVPMADGGEGLVDAVGGELRSLSVTGPDGHRAVLARWAWRHSEQGEPGEGGEGGDTPTGVIEMAQAAGLLIAGGPQGNDPEHATTSGVGELILAAVDAGARRVIVGCGGSATTDGGLGAVDVIGDPARLHGAEMLIACDVTTPFLDAAKVFGPQKGATPAQVERLTDRLVRLADHYRSRFGLDVTEMDGAGAAGGLAGGLAALGARLVPGFTLVSSLVGLPARVARADAVMTGEGRLDHTSLAGKVTGGVLSLAPPGTPTLCVVGDADLRAGELADRRPPTRLVRLTDRVGARRAHRDVLALVAEVVAAELVVLS